MYKKDKPIKFPNDESEHNSIIEWWYFNGHLKDLEGKEYSFMNCLFKVDVKKVQIPFLSRVPLKTAYFSHSLLSNIDKKKFSHRVTPLSLVSYDSFSKPSLFINYINPTIANKYTNCVIAKENNSSYYVKNEDVDLKLNSVKRPILEGGKGILKLGGSSSYYYSLTNMQTEGRIKIKDKWISVSGKSWMDHQWANSKFFKNKWNWFSIQLDSDIEMVCFMYDDGKKQTYVADISNRDGSQENYKKIEITPQKESWTSLQSKATYPVSWKIKIPEKNIELNLKAKIKNQEMLFGSINYWEGPLKVEGIFKGKNVTGVGFMELVGYPSKYGNVKFIRDEIESTVKTFFSVIRK